MDTRNNHNTGWSQIDSARASGASAAASAPTRSAKNGGTGHAPGVETTSDIRVDLVAKLRMEIAAGGYDTDEKLGKAIRRLARDLA
jgi:hypothetical protein